MQTLSVAIHYCAVAKILRYFTEYIAIVSCVFRNSVIHSYLLNNCTDTRNHATTKHE